MLIKTIFNLSYLKNSLLRVKITILIYYTAFWIGNLDVIFPV